MYRRFVVAFASLAALTFTWGCAGKPEDGLKHLQGAWVFTHISDNGKVKPEAETKKMEAAFENDKLQFLANGTPIAEFTFTLDPAKYPAEIDVVRLAGEHQGKAELGIFALEAGELKMCVAYLGKPRPTEFSANAKSERQFMILKKKS